jgi:hypothetical protein
MANSKHLKILISGRDAWNAWRRNSLTEIPDLSEIDLRQHDLSWFNLKGVNLFEANLRNAICRWTEFGWAIMRGADLGDADLSEADLAGVDFTRATLRGAILDGAVLWETTFANTDLTDVIGLRSCQHLGQSTVDQRTIAISGVLPDEFLKGCGIHPVMILKDRLGYRLESLAQFYTCFISYSAKDETFVRQLYSDLRRSRVQCWYAPEDLKIGARIRHSIDMNVGKHDRTLLVISHDSIESQWVEQEVETALEIERSQKRTVLFPVRIDDRAMQIDDGWVAFIKRTRNIGDFTNWQKPDKYASALERLLRDLKVEK